MNSRTVHNHALVLIFLWGCNLTLPAQQQEIKFDRITINDGLSLSSVYSIFQDHKGFLWFGTEDGLNKYDGANFHIYNNYPGNPNSLSHKWIEYIAEDHNGTIWTGSRHGVTALNPATDEMRQFTHVHDSVASLSNDTVSTMMMHEAILWVGTNNGLNRIDVNTQWNMRIETDTSRGHRRINALYADNQNRIWIGTGGGIFFTKNGSDKARNIVSNLPDGSPIHVNAILVEKDTLWVGHQNGLLKYILEGKEKIKFKYPGISYSNGFPVQSIHRDSKGTLWIISDQWLSEFKRGRIIDRIFSPDPSPSLATNPLKPMIEDELGNIWYGTFGDGIYRIDAESDRITNLSHHPGYDNSLSDNTINAIFQDRAGTIWVGTFGAGISIYKPGLNIIETLRHIAFSDQTMSSSFVWSIMEDSKGRVWIGTNTTGIDVYNPVNGTFRNIRYEATSDRPLPPFGVRDIFQARNGIIWAGSDGGGLCKLNDEGTILKRYLHDENNPESISNNSVRTIYQDTTGTLWIGTRHGLNRFNPATGKFFRYMHDPGDSSSISNDFVYSAIHMDRRGFLWLGTYGGGLNRLNTETGTFTSYRFDPDDATTISDDIVFSIYEDAKGYMWIGTNSGLNLFNPGNGKFKRYGTESGLPNEVIYGIMPDKQNRLWMTTNKGVSRLDLTEFRFKNYDVRDGLQSNEFNGGAFYEGKSGKLYAGGVYGLSIIDPEKMKPRPNTAEILVTRLEVLGKEVTIEPKDLTLEKEHPSGEVVLHQGNYYLKKHIAYLDELKLDFRERSFSIEFTAMNHPSPEKLNYRFRMLNLEESWTSTGNRNYVTFANMKPGNYVLQIDALNGDGFSAREQAVIKIIITPPFWYSPWFIALEVLLVLVIIIIVYRFLLNQRTNRILKDQFAQIKIAHEKLQESEQNLKELNATKDKFFSIISHDLKNPFASVLSISELMNENFETADKDEIKYGVKKIHQTNKHIYQLLENLLTWSKSQRGKLALETARFNLTKVVETNVNVLRLDAERKDINIQCNIPDEVFAFADREMISTVFRNLLNNAIKFTYPGKSVQVSIAVKEDYIELSISDEGTGISEENLAKLFSIEDKFKSDGTSGEKGTGLGLIICKEFIEKNNGHLYVDSQPGKGSTFSFTVPLASQAVIT